MAEPPRPPQRPPDARPSSEQEERRIDKLQSSVDDASRLVRNLTFIFLLVGLYIAILGGATNHELLLRAGNIQMPLLNIGASVVWFYALAPPLFLLLHFNLLLQLYFLSHKAQALDHELAKLPKEDQARQRGLLFPLHFTLMVLGTQYPPLIRQLLRIIVLVTIGILPVTLLLWMQLRFLPYQSFWITMEHRAVLTLDLLLVWLIWPMLGHASGRWLEWWRYIGERATRLPVLNTEVLPGRVRALGAVALGLLVLAFSWLVAVIPYSPLDRLASGLGIAEDVLDRPGGFIRRSLELPTETLLAREPAPALMVRHGEGQALLRFGVGLDLRNRTFREAYLYATTLTNALLSSADLESANFYNADLRGAILSFADLKNVDFRRADLSGTSLVGADLRGADLELADLQGTLLWGGADLRKARLVNADLRAAKVVRADLRRADLRGVNLMGADLQGADLQGADLRDADLRGADLRGAQLGGADLGNGSGLIARWHLADLRGADVELPADLAPEVLFDPRALGSTESMKVADYDRQFADGVLIPLACALDAPVSVTRNIAWRAIDEREEGRLYPGLVADALLGGDCRSATELPDHDRRLLERVAAR